jgi:DNA-binding domain/Domain of unknown function (DUF4469) with IG-like fold
MPINYALFENHLTTDPSDYAAQVKITSSIDLDGLAQRMIDQGSTVTKPDILAVLEDATKATESALLDGSRVLFGGLVDLFPRVQGVFNGLTDTFDPARHRVDVGANPGSRIRKTIRDQAQVVKQETIKPTPAPLEYFDVNTGGTNDDLTPGGIGQLSGHRLKYDEVQADEGIFFLPDGGGAETKVVTVQKNKPGQLVFLVPALASDNYFLEVRARIAGGTELRIGRLAETLVA